VYGRTAWYQTSDWNLLFVPTGFASGDDVFAVEADVYLPAFTTFERQASLYSFSTTQNVGVYQSTLGVLAQPWARSGTNTTLEFWTSAATGVQTQVATTPYPTFPGQWRRLRVEGVRSACRFRTLVDASVWITWTGACDVSGTYFVLGGNAATAPNQAQTAWSNMTIYKGSGSNCVP
jgi:hypothetical protein